MKALIIMLSCGSIVMTVLFGGCRTTQPSAEDMRKLVGTRLPIGSTKSQVTTFLDSRNISHSDIQEHNEFDEKHQWVKFRIMTASIRSDHFWSKSQVYMVFYFDDSDHLTKYDVKNVHTGL
jgi:hypothetical protein